MKRLFDELSHEVSRVTTQKYSSSFSLGILALSPEIRPAIYAIYGYVRLADEIVDSFHGYDKQLLLARLKEQTWHAIAEGISLNPILQSFQETVNHYSIDRSLIEQFLKSMEMDLHYLCYQPGTYKEYILGSAEVVGMMCLQIFVDGNKEEYERLKYFAMKLGSAFQKVNFLRDIKDDFYTLGRTYFPGADMTDFSERTKTLIENEIEAELKEALTGIKKLPVGSRFGVYLAYRYYVSLFKKIQRVPAEKILTERIRIPNGRKLSIMLSCYLQYKLAFF